MAKYDIFISYRRAGGYETAKHLYDLLTRDGFSVAFDIDTLRNGKFDEEIFKLISECKDFIIILNKGVFNRCLNPFLNIQNDWVRLELKEALRLKKNIIPVMLSGFSFPWFMPKDIRDIKFLNAAQHNRTYFNEFYNKLKSFLSCNKITKVMSDMQTPSYNDSSKIENDSAIIYIAAVKAGAYTMLGYSSSLIPSENNNLNDALEILNISLQSICNDYISNNQVDINLLMQEVKNKFGETAYEFASFGFLYSTVAMLYNTPTPEVRKNQIKKFIESGRLLAIPNSLLEYMSNAPLTEFKECLNKLFKFIPYRLQASKKCPICKNNLAADYKECPVCGSSQPE